MHMSDETKATEARQGLKDAITGKAKELAGAVTGSDSLTAEGQLQQTEATARREATARDSLADAQTHEADEEFATERNEAESERDEARQQASQLASKVQQERAEEKSQAEKNADRMQVAGEAVAEAETRSEIHETTAATRSELTDAAREEAAAKQEHDRALAAAAAEDQAAAEVRAQAERIGNPSA
jgi:uncharacterized protein YjbJ (UPF0337 family)